MLNIGNHLEIARDGPSRIFPNKESARIQSFDLVGWVAGRATGL